VDKGKKMEKFTSKAEMKKHKKDLPHMMGDKIKKATYKTSHKKMGKKK